MGDDKKWSSFSPDDARKRAGLGVGDKTLPQAQKNIATEVWQKLRKQHPAPEGHTVEDSWDEQIDIRNKIREIEATQAPHHEVGLRTQKEKDADIPLKPIGKEDRRGGMRRIDPLSKIELARDERAGYHN